MLIANFKKSKIIGGLGDRIKNVISTKLISDKLGKKFYINWIKENIKNIIDYSKYDFENIVINPNQTIQKISLTNQIEKTKEFCKLLETEIPENIFKCDINFIKNNNDISKYIYQNKHFKNLDYYKDLFNMYKSLYTDILIPKPIIISHIKNILCKVDKNNNKIIGIQIRAGDKWSNGSSFKPIVSENQIVNILSNIKNHIKINNYMIFLTSDYPNILKIAKKIFENRLLYYDKPIKHLEKVRNINNADEYLSKIFLDNYFLSQKTDILYISKYSNYGCIAALSCIHNCIFDIFLNKINLINITTKKLACPTWSMKYTI